MPEKHSGAPSPLESWLHSSLFEQVPVGIAALDSELRFVLTNSNFVAVFGESLGKACYEVYKKQTEPCVACAVRKTFADGKCRISDERGVDCIGSSADFVVHHSPVLDSSGAVCCVVNMSYDVTDRKSIQDQYNLIFEHAPCALSLINRDLRIVRANRQLRQLHSEALGARCHQVYKKQKERCEECPALATFADGQPHTSRQIRSAADGSFSYHLVSTALVPGEEGRGQQVVEMSLDITEAQVLSQRLHQENLFKEKITESALDALVAVDKDGTVNLFNGAAEKLFGRPAPEVVGCVSGQRFFPADFWTNLFGGAPSSQVRETIVAAQDGERIPVRFSGAVLEHEEVVIGAAGFFQDLRQLKALEEQKLQSERLAAVGQTVTQLAHSIKNILTGLQGGIYDLKTGGRRGDRARAQEGLSTLERNYQRITQLVREFLRFSKDHQPQLTPCDPVELAREVHALYRQVSEKNGIQFLFSSTASATPVPLDPEGIHTCLVNLVANAFDACREGPNRQCRIELTVTERPNELVFAVQDNGCGMAPSVQRKLFANLFTTKGPSGSGLGLVMTKKIVEDHGGSVGFFSEPGQGTRFWLVLPVRRAGAGGQ